MLSYTINFLWPLGRLKIIEKETFETMYSVRDTTIVICGRETTTQRVRIRFSECTPEAALKSAL